MTTSSAASSLTPSGLFELFLPPLSEELLLPPLVAQALSRLVPGTMNTPKAAARRMSVRRSTLDVGSGVEPSSGETDMFGSSVRGQAVRRIRPAYRDSRVMLYSSPPGTFADR